ncbi:MAG: chemotaxis response regulator protein-glutamate methylesterase [Pseudomonadota bacterium]
MPIRVIVVDDSPLMLRLISRALNEDSDIHVVATATNAHDARTAIKIHNPDVVTLDVEMPKMNGIDFLEKIMRLRPMPVVIVSTLTDAGTETAVRALGLGAVECLAKPESGNAQATFGRLREIVKAASKAKVKPFQDQKYRAPSSDFKPSNKIISIGCSTGGVEALSEVLKTFPENCPPTLVVQHMPAAFTATFARRLDGLVAPHVCEASEGAPLAIGQVYLAPGTSCHLQLRRGRDGLVCRLDASDAVSGHRPSVDILFNSVAELIGKRAVGAVLTGMGRDGSAGLLAMRQSGARTIGQDADTSLIYGMPRVAHELGAVERQLPLSKIGPELIRLCAKQNKENAAA